jgi:predicted transposase/invertase (TIGR01784 family)
MSETIPNPKIDLVFRKLFGSEENKDLLISLINSVVEPRFRITDVTIKNPFNLVTYRQSKESILDIKAVDQNGIWYDIEMQLTPHILYGKRAIYYLSKVYTEQLGTGSDYSSLNMTIGIHLLDFRYFPDDRVVRQFVFKDTETNDAPDELNCIQLYFVEMGKFNKDWPELRTALDRWIAFLNKAEVLGRNILPDELSADPAIVKAAKELERIGLNAEEREIYESEVKARMVDQIQLRTAEEEGLRQGMQRGMQHVLLHLMSRRIGEVPKNIASRLNGLNQTQLDDLSDALFDFTSYADVERWLTQH